MLLTLTDAVLGSDDAAVEAAIAAVRNRMGGAALVDAAATIASYDSIVKLADATGIPLETQKFDQTTELRAELGIES